MDVTQAFIDKIAPLVCKYAPDYGILVYSPIIAQGILESDRGRTELAVNANNFHGLKWRDGRCPTASGHYIKVGSEQNADGSYTSSVMKWYKFPNMDAGVKGYFDFINIPNYANLKGVTDPYEYLVNIKADGYATSLKYVENVYNVIKHYDLTRFDPYPDGKPIKIAIDAGHGKHTAGKRCLKSIDPAETREWVLNSRIAEKLIDLLNGYRCETLRIDDPSGECDINLATRCQKANDWGADIYISIHHNAGINGGSGGGTIVYYWSEDNTQRAKAQRLYRYIVDKTGLIGNRHDTIKKDNFAVLVGTTMPAYLLENGFMDSTTDVPIILTEDHADKTAAGLLHFIGETFDLKKKTTSEETIDSTTEQQEAQFPYCVKITADELNVRAGAGMAYGINTVVRAGEIYTIVDEFDGWGKLKSGAGWICLDYTKKIEESGSAVVPPEAQFPYCVKITADSLNVRAGAGMEYEINTVVRAGEIYTIVDTFDGWGKLKSGAGWICLDFVKRV